MHKLAYDSEEAADLMLSLSPCHGGLRYLCLLKEDVYKRQETKVVGGHGKGEYLHESLMKNVLEDTVIATISIRKGVPRCV